MFLEKVKNKAVSLYLTGKNKVIESSPQLLLAGGIVAIGIGVYEACNATLKIDEVLDEHKARIAEIEEYARNDKGDKLIEESKAAVNYDEKAAARDKAMIYGRTAGMLFKLYYKSIILLAGGIGMIVASHNILSNRLAGAIAAYTALNDKFVKYRSLVSTEMGNDLDAELSRQSDDAPKNSPTKNKKVKDTYTNYGFYYYGERGDNGYDALNRLLLQQSWARQRLASMGRLTMNEVLEACSAETTDEGMVVGWKADSIEEAYNLKFLINGYNITDERWRDYADQFDHDKRIWVGLNVDGIICSPSVLRKCIPAVA